MAKKDYVLIVDTETTDDEKVADFGAIVVDRKGHIFSECKVLIRGVFDNPKKHRLFTNEDAGELWNRQSLDRRYDRYYKMLDGGTRMLASIGALNRWIDKVKTTYNPYLTAYNLPFDENKCSNTGIDLAQFEQRKFCLWAAAADRWANTKQYKNFALRVHAFNNPTKLGNMTYKANAETMARFVLKDPDLEDEPHTAYEDVVYYELPIFIALAKKRKLQSFQGLSKPSWQSMQVKDHFIAK